MATTTDQQAKSATDATAANATASTANSAPGANKAGGATSKDKDSLKDPLNAQLSKNELERVTEVFKMYETGLREATIYPKDLAVALKKLGLNPTETEIQDLINEVEINGLIYYPAFCRIVMRKLREDDDENFHQELFRTLIGPKAYPDGVAAQLYNVNKEFLSMETFKKIMTSLPEYVDEAEVEDMFAAADKDCNGRITYREFKRMCEVQRPEQIPDEPIETSETIVNVNAKKNKKKIKKEEKELAAAAAAAAAAAGMNGQQQPMVGGQQGGVFVEKKQTVVMARTK